MLPTWFSKWESELEFSERRRIKDDLILTHIGEDINRHLLISLWQRPINRDKLIIVKSITEFCVGKYDSDDCGVVILHELLETETEGDIFWERLLLTGVQYPDYIESIYQNTTECFINNLDKKRLENMHHNYNSWLYSFVKDESLKDIDWWDREIKEDTVHTSEEIMGTWRFIFYPH